MRERFTHLGFAQGFDELLCLPHLIGVEPFRHQIETVRKVLKQFRGRVLLADEVGLGKTIEAGMVLKEYALRGMAERVLALAPASLVGQWREELETKFGLSFATTHDQTLRDDPRTFWGQKRIVASVSAARRRSGTSQHLLGGAFDLVIIDEAHHLRDWSSQSWKLVDALNKRFLLLLSATPVQNDLVELYNLMTLLKPGIFKTLKEFRAAYMTPGKPRQPANAERLRELMRDATIRTRGAVRRAELLRLAMRLRSRSMASRTSQRLCRSGGCSAPPRGRRRGGRAPLDAAPPARRSRIVACRRGGCRGAVRGTASRRLGMAGSGRTLGWRTPATGGKEMALLDLLRRNPDEKKLVFVHSRETLARLAGLLSHAGLAFARFDGSLSGPQKDSNCRLPRPCAGAALHRIRR